MKSKLIYAVSAAAMLIATPALAAECDKDLMAYNDEIMANQEYRARMDPRMRADIRQLRDSAHILQQAGQEEACQEVVAAIKDMVENPGETAEGAPSYDDWQTSEVERLKNAKSLDQLATRLRAEEIIGSDIRNYENKDLGEVEDLLLATGEGKTSYAIISHGGFLGLGEKQIAVPMQKLKVTDDKDVFVLNASEEMLENAPSFERGKFEQIADEAWREENDTYFKTFE